MSEPSIHSVLPVDDESAIRDVLSTELKNSGFDAQEAQDGIDALVKLRNSRPHVIISDLEKLRMSGVEFIDVVRRRFPQIPVIVFSGSAPHEFPSESKPAGWFEKSSLKIPDLVQAVQTLAEKSSTSPYARQVISIPVRTHRNGDGYFVLTCTDCLRDFQWASTSDTKTIEGTAACLHCEARVPFWVETSIQE